MVKHHPLNLIISLWIEKQPYPATADNTLYRVVVVGIIVYHWGIIKSYIDTRAGTPN
jgi:hypothetical protein